jgi:uncharacterized protein YhfF
MDVFWQAYVNTLPPDHPARSRPVPPAWGFGDSAALADELGDLVCRGVKTATCTLVWEFEVKGEAIPQPGELNIILDGAGQPLCIIETTGVEIKPYNAVEPAFAHAEGEGDRSLAYWRDAHWRYFSRVCPKIGRAVSEDMPLVCEHFRVVWP